MPSKKKKIKDSLIPPLDFVGSLPSERIPINDEYIPCTANYPRVRTIASENQPPWIKPHFDYSGFVRQPSQPARAFKDDIPPPRKRKSKSIIGPLNFSSEGTPINMKSYLWKLSTFPSGNSRPNSTERKSFGPRISRTVVDFF
nr:conserved hypothetical protein [Hymenolepis microstoma]